MSNDKRMNHLLGGLAEECGEVTQPTGKAIRFGLFSHNPKTLKTHWVSIRDEVHDLVAVYRMICDDIGISSELDEDKIQEKIDKVNKYYNELHKNKE